MPRVGGRRNLRAGKLDPAKKDRLDEVIPGWRQKGRRTPKGDLVTRLPLHTEETIRVVGAQEVVMEVDGVHRPGVHKQDVTVREWTTV
jgi:hypothetical protein